LYFTQSIINYKCGHLPALRSQDNTSKSADSITSSTCHSTCLPENSCSSKPCYTMSRINTQLFQKLMDV